MPPQRRAVTEVAASIDQLLQFQPAQQGESREEDRRVLFAHPLVVTFRVLEATQTVRVLYVRLVRSRGQA